MTLPCAQPSESCLALERRRILEAVIGRHAVAGLSGSTRSDAEAIGRVALAMLAHAATAPPLGRRHLDLRIGLHCGPATAGVIGGTRFSYDVWGDAVNIAARMEQHGVPGRIQVSEAFRACAGDAFAFVERGATEIKGIGAARTFFLERIRPRPPETGGRHRAT